MIILIKATIAASLACLAAAPGPSQQTAPPVIVTATPLTVHGWSSTVAQKLDRNLEYPAPLFRQLYAQGLVTVRFSCDERGRPANLAIASSSGSRALDRAALRAVARIDTLHPLPSGANGGERFAARVLFADSQESSDRMMRKINAEARSQNEAWHVARHGSGTAMAALVTIEPAA